MKSIGKVLAKEVPDCRKGEIKEGKIYDLYAHDEGEGMAGNIGFVFSELDLDCPVMPNPNPLYESLFK